MSDIDQFFDQMTVDYSPMDIQEKKALTIPCPTCGAGLGKKCESNTGKPRHTSHVGRRLVAEEIVDIIESVATVLEREVKAIVEEWMLRVDNVPALTNVPLSHEQRTGHLPRLLCNLIYRLRLDEDKEDPSTSCSSDYGKQRFNQGYSVSMLVDESRLLQISIFDTLRRNQANLDLRLVMADVVTIADECDLQLRRSVEAFVTIAKGRATNAASAK